MTERLIEGLPDDTQKLLQTYVKEVKGVFGEQLEGMLLYGSAVRGEFLPGRSNLNILLLVSSYDSAVLKKYSALHRRWSKEQIVVPLFLTEEELRTSAAVFPLEFLEIQEQHRVLGGRRLGCFGGFGRSGRRCFGGRFRGFHRGGRRHFRDDAGRWAGQVEDRNRVRQRLLADFRDAVVHHHLAVIGGNRDLGATGPRQGDE